MKKILFLTVVICIMTLCACSNKNTSISINAEPTVEEEVERETAEDGTEYISTLKKTTYPDGKFIVETKSEIVYTDNSVYCEKEVCEYNLDGGKVVTISITQKDSTGIENILENRTINYESDGTITENNTGYQE